MCTILQLSCIFISFIESLKTCDCKIEGKELLKKTEPPLGLPIGKYLKENHHRLLDTAFFVESHTSTRTVIRETLYNVVEGCLRRTCPSQTRKIA